MGDWHSLETTEVCKRLGTSASGLKQNEAERRLLECGRNELAERESVKPIEIFLSQFKDFLILILIAAAFVSGVVLKEMTDAIVILVIVILNAILGFQQEYKAEKSLSALKKLVAPQAHVIRDGIEKKIPASELVPGDVILISAGDRIPADARLIESANLRVDEASLTGESEPAEKSINAVSAQSTIGDQTNMLFMATSVTYGRGKAVVVATGGKTEIGKIAELVQSVGNEQTPLQKNLENFGKCLGWGALIICAFVFAVGSLTGKPMAEMFLASVSLAVAAIPEGLPAIVTISLAIGVQRMVKRHAIIRKLPAVETLGAATVICTDKTGTLTQNEMTVRRILLPSLEFVDVSGTGYAPKGEFSINGKKISPFEKSSLEKILRISVMCNDASIQLEKEEQTVIGDPTEIALITLAEKGGLSQTLRKELPREGEIPFDSIRKMMTTVHIVDGNPMAYVKGAPDIILEKSTRILVEGKERGITPQDVKALTEKSYEMAFGAMRLLGFAYRKLPQKVGEYTPENIEKELVFVGIAGMIDPPRPEAKAAIETCRLAGIKPILITGDHKLTAEAVAREIGMISKDAEAITGRELDEMSDEELKDRVKYTSIFARVSPEHKMRIVEALLANGEVVAMGGDGVNDAPALKRADIGIAMGIKGTDVAKESSDMILTDDNFASIVAAVEEGRGIYDNIRKFILFLLSSNTGEIFTVFFGILLGAFTGWPLPLTAIQILWVNLVTDGLPAIALGVDPKDPDAMNKPPRPKNSNIISKAMFYDMILVGFTMAMGALYVFSSEIDGGVVRAQTMVFTTVVMAQMFNVFNCRSTVNSAFLRLLSNKYLIAAVAFSIILQVAVIYLPPALIGALGHESVAIFGFSISLNTFGTTSLSFADWIKVMLISSTVVIVIEVRKRILK